MSEPYDVIIAGGGAAGLSAAILLGRCRHRVLLCCDGPTRNSASRAIHGLLGHEGRSPADLIATGRNEVTKYKSVEARMAAVVSISKQEELFSFKLSDGTEGSARKVLLATGLADELPKFPGVEALYGVSVHHCLYCDGFEHSNEPLAAFGYGDKGAGLAVMMRNWSEDVVLCTGGDGAPSPEMRTRLEHFNIKVFDAPIKGLAGRNGQLEAIEFTTGERLARSALFFSTGCHQRSDLSKQLGCQRDEKGGVITDELTEETSTPGVYVAGDVSRDVLLVAVASAEGIKAGVAISRALMKAGGLL